MIDELRQGHDVLAIGVNGTAINDGEGLSGIWVSSVQVRLSGQPGRRQAGRYHHGPGGAGAGHRRHHGRLLRHPAHAQPR
ncbi:MAG: hypothetical protein V9H69_12735 [Anaerolineae bacterium]